MMKNVLLMVALMVGANVFSQKHTTFRSIQQLALINGRDHVSGSFQSIYGVQHKNWFGGIGGGLDFYQQRTVPLFVDMRKEVNLKKGKAFAYGDAGYHIPWLTNRKQLNYTQLYNHRTNSGITVANKFDGGWLVEAGVGYAVYFTQKQAVTMSVGYGFKQYRHQSSMYSFYNPGQPDGSEDTFLTDRKFSLNLFVVKAGWQF